MWLLEAVNTFPLNIFKKSIHACNDVTHEWVRGVTLGTHLCVEENGNIGSVVKILLFHHDVFWVFDILLVIEGALRCIGSSPPN